MSKITGKGKATATEDLFGDVTELRLKQLEKEQAKPLKPLKQIKEEEKTEVVVSDFKEMPKAPEFKQSNAASDEIFSQTETVEEGMSKLLTTITTPENIEHFTDLDESEVTAVAALTAVNAEVKSEVLGIFLHEFKQHRVSKGRAGRNEIVEIARSMLSGAERSAKSALDSIRGVFSR